MVRLAAIVVGAIAALPPLIAGVLVLLAPLRRSGAGVMRVRITTLDALPDDGVPRQFAVIADRTDAWNTYLNDRIGSIYLRRLAGTRTVLAWQVICPHLGCFIDYNAAAAQFQCPCHESKFELTGERIDPESCKSPRDMDSLVVDEARLAETGEVWIEFKTFRSSTSKKIAEG
jgi:nitrite reductase/ring-hydroxylating ferredoxin subunit